MYWKPVPMPPVKRFIPQGGLIGHSKRKVAEDALDLQEMVIKTNRRPPQSSTTIATALETQELSFIKGERLEVLEHPEFDPEWLRVRNSAAGMGLVPKNYVQRCQPPPSFQPLPNARARAVVDESRPGPPYGPREGSRGCNWDLFAAPQSKSKMTSSSRGLSFDSAAAAMPSSSGGLSSHHHNGHHASNNMMHQQSKKKNFRSPSVSDECTKITASHTELPLAFGGAVSGALSAELPAVNTAAVLPRLPYPPVADITDHHLFSPGAMDPAHSKMLDEQQNPHLQHPDHVGEERQLNIADQSWYYAVLSRDEADRLLDEFGQPGDFLIRDSESNPGDYSISLKAPGRNKHFWVRVVAAEDEVGTNGDGISAMSKIDSKGGSALRIGNRQFASFARLLDYYARSPIYTNDKGEKLYLVRPLPG